MTVPSDEWIARERLLGRLSERTRGKWEAEDERDRLRAELIRLADWCESQRVSPTVADLRAIAGAAPSCVCGATLGGVECGTRAHLNGPRAVKWADLFGIAPNFTGGKDVNEYLDESRGEA